MTNWGDPSVIAFCAFIYNQIAVFLLGFFGYVPPFPTQLYNAVVYFMHCF